MSIPLLIEDADLELAIGAETFAQLCDHAGRGEAQPRIVQHILRVGSDEAANLLAPGFSTDEIIALVRRDAALRHKIALIGIGVAGVARREFADAQGKFLYADAAQKARAEISAVGTKKERSAAEQQNGSINRRVGPRVGQRVNRPRYFVFADARGTRGSGGY